MRRKSAPAGPSKGPPEGPSPSAGAAVRGGRGFTLIEMVVVLLVLSLASLFILPDLQPTLQRTRRTAAMRRMSAYLDDIRTRSVSSGTTIILAHDDEGNRLLATEDGGEGRQIASFDIPGEIEVVETDPAILRYYPQGHSSGMVMTLRYAGRWTYRLEVGSFTGLARVEESG